ncbi:hypothetical protein TRFO_25571 [Tritrichomonas foetus]|uniref:Uncharacterized protein n=1 Tax=Tritrichomonas foetus TaxID=1144522 RepID=A0A1J4KAH2_9EUKA|nr:hypothetical protein TRFO_25571 [Tritrichomonas foetus]|eukprot:OHT06453.1 hypothetical protein TRFO_25571 [Tritrichomonas foetus]
MQCTPFAEIINKFEKQLEEGEIDKATNQLHHVSSRLNPKIFHSTQCNIVALFTDIMTHVLPTTKHRNDKLRTRATKFLNHWFYIFASFLPQDYFIVVKNLYDSGNVKYMESTIAPFVESFKYCQEKELYVNIFYNIVKEVEFNAVNSLPEGTWHIIKDYHTEDRVCEMIRLYIEHETNEDGVAILILKNHKKFLELMFQTAHLKFIDKCLKSVPKDLNYDVFTLSARVSDALFLDGGNLSLAYDIIPMIVKSNLDDIQAVAYRPFWTSACNYLHQRNSTSCLYALHSGWKNDLVSKEDIIPFLKLDMNTDQRYRLASFQIGIDFFDEPDFQPKMLDMIKEISITRNNPIFCCLVDNLNLLFNKISAFDKHTAISIVNSVMNPIPYDEYLPNFILKFLNSIDLDEPEFTFSPVEVVYKYMNILDEAIVPELKKLIHKIGMIVDFKKIDWFDLSILLSLHVTDVVDPALIHELLIFDYIHISLIPLAIDLITKSGESLYFDYALGTLIKVVKKFGFNLNSELEKRGFRSIRCDKTWIDDSILSHSFNKTSVLISHSNLGKVAISIVNYIISIFDQVEPSKKVIDALALVSKFLLHINIEVATSLLLTVQCEEPRIVDEITNEVIKQISYAEPEVIIEFLLKMKGPEETLNLAKEQVHKVISINYNIAKEFAPVIEQPLEIMPTFEAFEGIEKHHEWVEKCRKEIPENKLISPRKEEPLIEEEIKEEHFELQQITIEKGIEQIGDGYKYDLINLFYFSKKELPIPIQEVEEFVISNASDVRLIIGFFYYSYNHNYHTTRAEQWTKIIKFTRDEKNLYAASLFLLTLTGVKLNNLPVYLSTFLLTGLRSLGYYMLTKKNLTIAFRAETAMRWFFIRSIINLDIDYFADDSLILAEFSDPSTQTTIFKNFFNKLPVQENIDLLMATFISLTHVYFIPQKIIHLRPYPLVHVCLYHLKYIGGMPPTIKLEDAFINSLLAALEKQPFFPVVFFTFFAYVRLSDAQFKRVHDLLEPRTSSSGSFFRFLLPAAYFDRPDVKMVIDEKAAIHFSNRPPSYSRAFYRSLMLPFTPMLPQKLIVEICDLLCPVFPPFSYNALNMWSTMNNYDKIIYQKYPANAMEKFKIVSNETVDIYRSTMCDPLYKKRKDITRRVVKASFSAQSSPPFALDIVDAILSMGHGTGFKDCLHEAKIVNMPNFLCFCLVFKHADKILNIPTLKQEVADLIEDPERKEIFLNLDKPENIEKLIHPSLTKE